MGFANPLAALNRALPVGISTLPPRVLAHIMANAPPVRRYLGYLPGVLDLLWKEVGGCVAPRFGNFRVLRRLPVLQRHRQAGAEVRTVVPIYRAGGRVRLIVGCRRVAPTVSRHHRHRAGPGVCSHHRRAGRSGHVTRIPSDSRHLLGLWQVLLRRGKQIFGAGALSGGPATGSAPKVAMPQDPSPLPFPLVRWRLCSPMARPSATPANDHLRTSH